MSNEKGTLLMPRSKTPRIPGQTIPCGWCGMPIALRTTGRLPKWCSDACRHRAWEQQRARASERTPVEVVDRVIEVEKRVRVVERVEVPARPRRDEWAGLLMELTKQIDSGRVYDRHLHDIAVAMDEVLSLDPWMAGGGMAWGTAGRTWKCLLGQENREC